jgi:hypothetical protein
MVNRLPPFVGFVKIGSESFVGSLLFAGLRLFVVDVVGSLSFGTGPEAGPQAPLSRFAFQYPAQGLNFFRGPTGEIGEGAVFDLAVEAEGLAEEDGWGRAAVRDGSHIHAYIIS